MSTDIRCTTTLLAILLAVLLRAMASAQPPETNVLCVKMTGRDQSCLTASAVHTFVEYLHDYQHLFASNTTVHFTEGEHIVNSSGNISEVLSLANLEDFILEGPAVHHGEPPAATVRCTRPFHFLFTNMTRLVIRNIKVINCSPLNFTPHTYYNSALARELVVAASLMTLTTYDLVLHNVHISESCGYGLFCYNSLGVSKLSYCNFQNNSGNAKIKRPGGNALISYINAGLVTLKNQSNRLEILNCIFFLGNNHGGSGGLEIESAHNYNSNITIQIASSQFYNNSGTHGANLRITDEGLRKSNTWIEIDSCCFYNGNSSNGGGSFSIGSHYKTPLLITLLSSTFMNNLAGSDGGAIYVKENLPYYPEHIAIITNCTFSDNKAMHNGGAISSTFATVNITNCTFKSNTAVNRGGGAIYLRDSSLFANNCSFHSNTAAKQGGGAIYIEIASLFATNCSFESNTALGNGGHINSVMGKSLSLVNCSLKKGCSSRGDGGGICLYSNDDFKLQILNCTFLNNTAKSGGGLGFTLTAHFQRLKVQYLVNITDCHFVKNHATHGGGMYMLLIEHRWNMSLWEICIQQSWFIGNSADSGGGLEAHFTPHLEQESTVKITVNTTKFIGNVARDEGSAINMLGCGPCHDGKSIVCKQVLSHTVILAYGLFIQNRVCQLTNKASTINVNMMSIHLESTEFISNIGSGILASNAKITTNGKNIFKDNIAIVGGAFHLDCYPTSLPLINYIQQYYIHTCRETIKLQSSNIILSEESLITTRNNTAIQFGGAIAVNEQCAIHPSESDAPPCFYRTQTINNSSRGGKVILNSIKR